MGRVDTLERLVRSGFLTLPRTAVADVAYTAQSTDYIIAYSVLSAGRQVTLPSAVTDVSPGKEYVIKDETGNAGSFNITVAAKAGETIDGAATKVINSAFGVLRIYSTAIGWAVW